MSERKLYFFARRTSEMMLAIVATACAARIDFEIPGSAVPQSAQTLVVLLTGVFLGARGGALALVAYLAAGAAGVPVFAGGASGLAHLHGPTGGYLVGFVVAAGLVGWLSEHRYVRNLLFGLAGMLAAHALILLLGGLWLARVIGLHEAYARGVAPFLMGGVAKSLLAALIGALWCRVYRR